MLSGQVAAPSLLSDPAKLISFVIPAYNEALRLPATLDETLGYALFLSQHCTMISVALAADLLQWNCPSAHWAVVGAWIQKRVGSRNNARKRMGHSVASPAWGICLPAPLQCLLHDIWHSSKSSQHTAHSMSWCSKFLDGAAVPPFQASHLKADTQQICLQVQNLMPRTLLTGIQSILQITSHTPQLPDVNLFGALRQALSISISRFL